MKKIMNILCASDRNFLYPTYVFMQSVIENHKDVQVDFYLLAGEDITENDKAQLKSFINKNNCKIEFMSIDSNMFNNFVLHEKFPRSAYYRLMAHTYLPQDMDRILYMDVDIVVDKNIYDDFYTQDFEGNYLIATSHNPNPDFCNMLTSEIVNYESAARGEYFNSGVLLMNLDLFRKNITLDDYNKAYKTCEDNNLEIFYDQGLLNYMFCDKTKYFSSMDYNFRFSIPKQNAKRLDPNREYKQAIVHYTGMCQPYKPWDLMLEDDDIEKFGDVPFASQYFYVSKELNDLLKIWWKYAESTPIYNEVYSQMKLKQKWFKRQLMDFVLDHNNLIAAYESKNYNALTKTIYKNGNAPQLHIHWKAYKVGCIICSPFLLLKKFVKKLKKKK